MRNQKEKCWWKEPKGLKNDFLPISATIFQFPLYVIKTPHQTIGRTASVFWVWVQPSKSVGVCVCVCQSEGQLSVKLSPDSLGSVSWAAVGLSDTFPLEVEVWKCVGGWVCEGVTCVLWVSFSVSHLCTDWSAHLHRQIHAHSQFRALYSIFSLLCLSGVWHCKSEPISSSNHH